MKSPEPGSSSRAPATPPEGFEPLTRLGLEPKAQAGCPFVLGVFLLLPGAGAVALYFTHPEGKGDPLVMLIVGLAFAAVGLLLLIAGTIGLRGLKIPRTELFLERGAVLRPGATARLRLRQPGPVRFDSLVVGLAGERVYQRRVRPRSTAMVEDRERLHEKTLLDLKDWRVAAGADGEQEIAFSIPPNAPPTGPALPDGSIRWLIEARGDAGVMRGTYHAFGIRVER